MNKKISIITIAVSLIITAILGVLIWIAYDITYDSSLDYEEDNKNKYTEIVQNSEINDELNDLDQEFSETKNSDPDTTFNQNQNENIDAEILNSPGVYEDFSSKSLIEHEDKTKILFFKANWCSTCNLLDGNIEDKIDEIPGNIAILIVDYDDSSELRKKYGVTIQHTLVQIDNNGKQVNKWSGSRDLQDLLDEVV